MKAKGTTLLVALSVQFMCVQYGSCCFRRWFFPTTTTTPAPTTTTKPAPTTTTTPAPTTTKTTTTPPTTIPVGCMYKGEFFHAGEDMPEASGWDGDWCYYAYCSQYGDIEYWNGTCLPWGTTPTTSPETLTTPPTTIPQTSYPFTTIPPGMCEYEGTLYHEGDVIDSGQSDNWCWTMECGSDGEILHGDDFNCGVSSPEPEPPCPTIPPGMCEYKGTLYHEGQEIDPGKDYDNDNDNWCLFLICGSDGEILHGLVNCGLSSPEPESSPEPTSVPPTTIPAETTTPQQTTPPSGLCFYNGQYYPQGATIESTSAPGADQCWGRFCGDDGDVVVWQNPDCGTSTTTTRRYTTTTPGAARCYYKGNYYPEGEHVNDYDTCLVCACWSGEMQCGGLWTVPDCKVNGTDPIITTPILEPEPECETGNTKTESCQVWMCAAQGLWEAYHFTATEECCMGIERPECETMIDTTLPPKPKTTFPYTTTTRRTTTAECENEDTKIENCYIVWCNNGRWETFEFAAIEECCQGEPGARHPKCDYI